MREQPKTTESRSLRIEDYALIGDLHTAALVGRDGSIDWLCLPRFDSPACFASLVGDDNNGRWLIAPAGEVRSAQRRYRDDTLVLETIYETAEGRAAVVDFMPHDGEGDETRLVHRLDRGASGCLLLGLGAATTAELQAAQAGPDATKTYLALVRGVFRWTDVVTVDTPIASMKGPPRPARRAR